VEVDLTRQVLLLAVDGRVQWVFDTSTGRVPGTTVAIHGYPSVPPYPASRGASG